MENIIILETTPQKAQLPIKKRPYTAENKYEELKQYPIEKDIIRYTSKRRIETIHDIVSANLTALIPNIDIGYQTNMEENQLIDWILKTKEYASQLNNEFQKQCDKKMQKVITTEQHKYRSKELDMNKVNQLPEDIIRYIHGYLMPETRIVLLRARYPNLNANIMKLNVAQLKKLLENTQKKYYYNMMSKLYKYNRARCLPNGFHIRFSYTNKPACLDSINKLIGTCETAVAHTPQDYRYFQRRAFRILRALVYVAKRKQVLDKAYAPELEPPKQEKKPRKPRSKKQS